MWAYAPQHHYRTTNMPPSILLTQGPVLLGGREAAASTGAPAPDSSHSHLKVIMHVSCTVQQVQQKHPCLFVTGSHMSHHSFAVMLCCCNPGTSGYK